MNVGLLRQNTLGLRTRFNPCQPYRLASRRRLCVRADSDDEMIPILSGRSKKGFTAKEYDQLAKPQLLGGKTVSEELEMIRQKYLNAETRAAKKEQGLNSSQWDGDVYIGGRWNTLSILYLIGMLVPAGIGVFAWLSYGKLWGVSGGGFY